MGCTGLHTHPHASAHAHTCTHAHTRAHVCTRTHSASWRGRLSAFALRSCVLSFTPSTPSCPGKKVQRSLVSLGCHPLLTASRAPRWVLEGARWGRGSTGNFDGIGKRWGLHTGDSDLSPVTGTCRPGRTWFPPRSTGCPEMWALASSS